MSTFPFWSLAAESRELGLVVGVGIGFAFGFVLERAGFGRAQKLMGQFYGYDLAVLKVMFGAVVVAMVGSVVFSGLGLLDWKAMADHATSETFLWPQIIGGFALGVGFVVSGYCPGTSYVSLASGKIDGLVTVIGVTIGQLVWAGIEHLGPIPAFQNGSNLGHRYLYELIGLPDHVGPAVVALAVAAMAIGAFIGGERIERAIAGTPASAVEPPGSRPRRLVFAGIASFALVGLGLGLLPSGSGAAPAAPQTIEPMALAQRVLDEPWKVRVLDLRAREACAAQRVPGAECVPEPELARLGLADASGARELVLVGAGSIPALPAAAAAYPGKVRVLAGGFPAWEAYALKAPEPPAPGAAPAELASYRLRAGIAAALTGVKAAPPPPIPAGDAAPRKKAGGGGCGG